MGNRATLKAFANEVKQYCQDSTVKFRRISVVASASPEGSQQLNSRLAKLRAQAITNWISREISVKLEYDIEATRIDWNTLTRLVENSTKVPYRDEVLDILRNTSAEVKAGGATTSERFTKLRALRSGEPYRWKLANLFPELRYAAARAEFWIEPNLDVDTAPQHFPAGGGSGTIAYSKNVDDGVLPHVTSRASWIKNISIKGDAISYDVVSTRSKNPRSTEIVIAGYGKVYRVPVSQNAATPALKITSPSPMNFSAKGGKGVVTFERNVDDDATIPAVRSKDAWVVTEQPTADSVAFTVAPNKKKEGRSSNIAIECYDNKYKVAVNQAAVVKKPFYMAVKTNMLYDLAAVPNLGAEFYLGKGFSVAANYTHAWWDDASKNLYWRYYGAEASLRWWFGKASKVKPLQGHHIGASYQMLTYDFQLGDQGLMAGQPGGMLIDRPNHVVSLEYGYSLPIARRLNLDFAIGVGYHWGVFEEYKPIDGHNVWQATKQRRYIGPTKLEVSLVWLIGHGNYNDKKRKEGKR